MRLSSPPAVASSDVEADEGTRALGDPVFDRSPGERIGSVTGTRSGEALDVAAYFRALLDFAPDAMVIADSNGCITLVNERVEALFGYQRHELIGRPVEVLIPERFHGAHPRHRAGYFVEPRARAMGGGGLGLVALRKDGTEFPAEISLSPVRIHDGVVAVTAIRDITERKLAEQQATTLLQAQESVRMRDEFLAVAAHELKTPLAALKLQVHGIVRALGRNGPMPSADWLGQRVAAVNRSVERLDALVDNLLDLSRITAGRLELQCEPTDLVSLTRGVITSFAHETARIGSVITLSVDEARVEGNWDAMRVEQVVTNLVSNALKYGNRKPIQVIISRPHADLVRIAVRDEGIGIAAEHLPRLFGRFERAVTDRAVSGIGLGLWIARQIVEAHGGAISAASEPGVGSTFVVDLPRLGPGHRTDMRPPPTDSVLVVDDDAELREAISLALSDEGVRVLAAKDGADALRMLREGARPALIVLDLMMRDMDGWAFRAEQRRDPTLASIPVVVCSAAADLDRAARDLGAVGFVRKPVGLEPFLAAVLPRLKYVGG